MRYSAATPPRGNPAILPGSTLALALQGGGAHGAFGWGVVDQLLADGLLPDRVCGVSSGALLGAMLVQGLVQNGPAGARAQMRLLWERVGQTSAGSGFPLERWLRGWDLSNNFAWQGMETAMRLFSPSQLNPLGHNPLRAILEDLLDRDALAAPEALKLTVGATDVETGQAVLFTNRQIDVDVLLASSCLPLVFPAVQIKGRAYWDGGYSGNPPLRPLLAPGLPDALVLVQAQASHRKGVPALPTDILNRLNEIACQATIDAELAALPPTVALHRIDADSALMRLPISSKVNTEPAFLEELCRAGQLAARRHFATAATGADLA